jgi:hypothetical protein
MLRERVMMKFNFIAQFSRVCVVMAFGLAVMTFGAASAYAACTSPAGTEGQQVYNTTHKIMQYCDGTNWIGMGSVGGSGGGGAATSQLANDPDACVTGKAGSMRWTGTDFEGCDGSDWRKFAVLEPDLYNGDHNEGDCTLLGGTVMDAGGESGGESVCRFAGSTCPTNWTQYSNWSNTSAKSCSNSGGCISPQSCTTGSHSWANSGQETCSYRSSAMCSTYLTCTANYTHKGCY